MSESIRNRVRLRAPRLEGRGWLNTGGRSVSLDDLRGKVVVLDFWTFCCVNCLHVLDELRPLEEKYADHLVLIGVHSPKFEHEADPDALVAAVERYAVHHPVLDDPSLTTWKAYTARAWPTLVVIDPEGYIVASMSGEGHAHGLAVLVEELIEEHRAKGTLRSGDGPYVAPPAPSTALRFPGKLAALPDGSVLLSDTAHHQVVHLEDDLSTERARYGSADDFNEPQGLLVLPPEVASRIGYDVVVADSVNHQIKGIRLADGAIGVLAGTGSQLRERSGSGPALKQDLSTPWDVAWWIDRVVIAMAGTHQLWALHLAPDPADSTVAVLAGTSSEGVRDGAADDAWFAQPSGLASSADGSRLWIADSETSALRSITLTDNGFEVSTHVGQGLFDFGHRDGAADQALLQHPLGVTELPDGSVAISDTYNGAVRRFDPASGEVTTLATGLAEPSDALVVTSPGFDTGSATWVEPPEAQAEGESKPAPPGSTSGSVHLAVVESAAHRVTRVALPDEAQRVDGPAHRTQRPPTELASGPVTLRVAFEPPTGQKLDLRWGDPTQLVVSASPEELIRDGAGTATGLTRTLDLDPAVGAGTLHVSVRAAACDGDPITGEVPEHAACHLYQQDWGIPVILSEGAPARLDLDLRGV
ncbi:NHL domain-containing thioredoxin family protein [Luteipulveratus halotolerans]|uniref:Alkyl hydroperoxide reductase / thiol specific antioxidant / Mal allergen n=1 Tax=Luteipulveratus halotolerans TaxID=1631356 RepID=A0A0L6CNH7_9MICO|nr:NHL domain-containing thioredoxin family protein [Luteipulveratus halotolerans]KNX39073.1 alkyl hydroperoxide reductase / thiol specific antioxidant / Mal allergen [Luteipulveratus halotolerans]